MKLDSVFNEEWAKSYDGGFLEVPGVHSSLVVTNDGYIMVGQQEYFASSSGTNRTKGYIVKTDKNGNKTWDKLVGYPYRDVGYRGIVASGINKFMLLGVVAEDTGWNGMARAVLAKMDTAGNIFWQREYNHYNASDSDHVYPSQIVQLLNGDFLISGYVLYPYPTSHHNDAWLMKTDSCGYTEGDVSVAQIQADSIINKTVYLHNTSPEYCSWQWYFGDGDSSSVRHPTHTYSDSGRYIITLITKAGNDRDTAYLQVEIDTSIVNSQQSIVKPQMQLYPNPAKDYIILSGYIPESSGKAMLELYDMQGKLVERQMLETGPVNRSIGTRNLATGVYAYRVYTNTETIKTGRVYVE